MPVYPAREAERRGARRERGPGGTVAEHACGPWLVPHPAERFQEDIGPFLFAQPPDPPDAERTVAVPALSERPASRDTIQQRLGPRPRVANEVDPIARHAVLSERVGQRLAHRDHGVDAAQRAALQSFAQAVAPAPAGVPVDRSEDGV